MSNREQRVNMSKRVFDTIFALLGLIILSPIFVIVSILIKIDSRGPILYKQTRVGKNFSLFVLYKFRSMYSDERNKGPLITAGDDPRITKVGRFIRKTKIDELPQLYNVLKGDMSLVGPRPEMAKFVNFYEKQYKKILTFRPGMTDIASLKFSNEEDILAKNCNFEHYYTHTLLPQKIKLYNDYIERASFIYDLKLILRTIIKISELHTVDIIRTDDKY